MSPRVRRNPAPEHATPFDSQVQTAIRTSLAMHLGLRLVEKLEQLVPMDKLLDSSMLLQENAELKAEVVRLRYLLGRLDDKDVPSTG